MRRFIVFLGLSLTLAFSFAQMSFAQGNRSNTPYGAKGLAMTKEILSELDLPSWYWGGAHIYEEVERNHLVIDGDLLVKYISKFPATGLNDPQYILDDKQRERIEGLVAAHDMRSAMPLYVNVLSHGQKMLMRDDEIRDALEHQFREKNALVVYYYYGYARGVKGYVLLEDTGIIEGWEVDELFLKSAQDASIQVEKFSEIESFVTEFSKRSYWLEQRLITPVVAVQSDAQEKDEPKKSHALDGFSQTLCDHTLTLTLVLGSLLTGAWYYLWTRKWRNYVIPNGDVPVRLGAEHGAYISDTLEFSDPKNSLTDQHERIKNKEL